MNITEALTIQAGAVVDRLRDSVVSIEARGGFGAGVVWRSDGWILTNDHVVQRQESTVTFRNGKRTLGRLVARDREHDLALLKVESANLLPLARGDARSMRTGEALIAVGHPLGLREAASFGIVSAKGGSSWTGTSLENMLQADISLAPGNSGGPLVNASGELVGIASMVLSPGIALAIPTHVAETFVREVELRLAA